MLKSFLYSPAVIPISKAHQIKEITKEENWQFKGYRNVSEPTLACYLPSQEIATGAVKFSVKDALIT